MASSLTMSPKSGPTEEWELVGNDGDEDVKMGEADRLGPSAQLGVSWVSFDRAEGGGR